MKKKKASVPPSSSPAPPSQLPDIVHFLVNKGMIGMIVGFVIGNAFSVFIMSIITNIMVPCAKAILPVSLTSRMIILRQGRTPYASYSSVAEATSDGAVALDWALPLTTLLNLVIQGIVVYYVVLLFVWFEKRFDAGQPPTPIPSS